MSCSSTSRRTRTWRRRGSSGWVRPGRPALLRMLHCLVLGAARALAVPPAPLCPRPHPPTPAPLQILEGKLCKWVDREAARPLQHMDHVQLATQMNTWVSGVRARASAAPRLWAWVLRRCLQLHLSRPKGSWAACCAPLPATAHSHSHGLPSLGLRLVDPCRLVLEFIAGPDPDAVFGQEDFGVRGGRGQQEAHAWAELKMSFVHEWARARLDARKGTSKCACQPTCAPAHVRAAGKRA